MDEIAANGEIVLLQTWKKHGRVDDGSLKNHEDRLRGKTEQESKLHNMSEVQNAFNRAGWERKMEKL